MKTQTIHYTTHEGKGVTQEIIVDVFHPDPCALPFVEVKAQVTGGEFVAPLTQAQLLAKIRTYMALYSTRQVQTQRVLYAQITEGLKLYPQLTEAFTFARGVVIK